MVTATTQGIKISVETFYHPKQSRPRHSEYAFAYRIRIYNNNPFTVQLISRHWHIFDSSGMTREIEGEGVAGEQPIIQSGNFHEYFSACYLETEFGRMYGTYLMQRLVDGMEFQVRIPAFQMIVPARLN